MRISFLPIQIFLPLLIILGLVALYYAFKKYRHSIYFITFISGSVECFMEATRKILEVKKITESTMWVRILDVAILVIAIPTIAPIVIDFNKKTKHKPELRKIGQICGIGILIILAVMTVLLFIKE